MDIKFIIGIIVSVVLGVIAIVQSVRAARKQQPTFGYRTTHIIGRGSNAPPELKVMFKGIEVEDVYRTRLLFFNAGNDVLNYSDVARAIGVSFNNSDVLKASIIQASREVNKFSIEGPTEYQNETERNKFMNVVELKFEWLGRTDGAVVEVLHTKFDKLEAVADFKNAKLRFIKWDYIDFAQLRRNTWFAGVLATLSLLFFILYFIHIWADGVFMGILLLILPLIISFEIAPNWVRRLSVPKWARW